MAAERGRVCRCAEDESPSSVSLSILSPPTSVSSYLSVPAGECDRGVCWWHTTVAQQAPVGSARTVHQCRRWNVPGCLQLGYSNTAVV